MYHLYFDEIVISRLAIVSPGRAAVRGAGGGSFPRRQDVPREVLRVAESDIEPFSDFSAK